MGKYTYAKYDSDKYLLYADIADKYPREEIKIPSGNNILSAYLYGKDEGCHRCCTRAWRFK